MVCCNRASLFTRVTGRVPQAVWDLHVNAYGHGVHNHGIGARQFVSDILRIASVIGDGFSMFFHEQSVTVFKNWFHD